jgi:alcohol dehydrogenase
MNIKRIQEIRGPEDTMLIKYARAGQALSCTPDADVPTSCDLLVQKLDEWTERLSIPRLGQYGVAESDLDTLAAQAGQKSNSVQLGLNDVKAILRARL